VTLITPQGGCMGADVAGAQGLWGANTQERAIIRRSDTTSTQRRRERVRAGHSPVDCVQMRCPTRPEDRGTARRARAARVTTSTPGHQNKKAKDRARHQKDKGRSAEYWEGHADTPQCAQRQPGQSPELGSAQLNSLGPPFSPLATQLHKSQVQNTTGWHCSSCRRTAENS
jgi:hypothetical protein